MAGRIVHIALCNNYNGMNKILYIPECVNAGLDVHYINLAELIGGRSQGVSANECIESNVSTLEGLDSLLSKFRGDTLFNVQIGYEHRWKEIFQVIKNRCQLTSTFAVGKFPRPDIDKSFSVKNVASFPRKVVSRLLASADKFYPSYVFAAGRLAAEPFCGKSQIIKIEHREFCDVRVTKTLIDLPKNFIVFIDQYTPFHPDRNLTGITATDSDLYYKNLLKYFEGLEDATGVEIVVAAHPKSDYPPDFFGERRVIANHTEELIRESSLVLSHFSTAVCHAVKHDKPLVFISSTSETGLDIKRYVLPFARYFNAPCHHLGANMDSFEAAYRDMARYESYKFDYLTWPEADEIVASTAIPECVKKLNFTMFNS